VSATAATTGSLVWRLSMQWRAAVDRAVALLGLTHAQYVVLASLYSLSLTGARPSQRELADYTGLEPVYVSRLARALEAGGMIDRTDDPGDPRAVELTLTAHGIDVVLPAIAVVRELHEVLLAPIGGVDGARNSKLVATLQALLGEHARKGEASR
jgi:MarR family transcriptional regulator, organic hydroperoxide resistance regulator